MDDFGSIIYIVFTIIAVVFSIMKKNKQKEKTTTIPTESSDPLNEVLPTFEKIFGNEKLNPVPKPVDISEPIKKKEVVNSFEAKKREMESRFSRIKKEKPVEKEISKESSEEQETYFNLRKAVIYSEILRRPDL